MYLGLLILFTLFYFVTILAFLGGLNSKVKYYDNNDDFTIVIPFKNEENRIKQLLDSLKRQDEKRAKVLFINDNSDDGTVGLINKILQNSNLDFKILDSNGVGKKQALQFGIDNCTTELIICTDADCSMNANWASSIVNCFNDDVQMVSSAVKIEDNSIQSLEFASLIAVGAASIGIQKPMMCNAANMAFKKSIFDNGDDILQLEQMSGDDVFLLHYVERRYGAQAIVFNKQKDSIVITQEKANVISTIKQRSRWASKVKAYKDVFSKFIAVVVFTYCLLLIIGIGLSAFGLIFNDHSKESLIAISVLITTLLISLSSKMLVDFAILYKITGITMQRKNLLWFFPAAIIYPFYVVIAAVSSLFIKKW